MRVILLYYISLCILVVSSLYANENNSSKTSSRTHNNIQIQDLLLQKNKIDEALSQNNIWSKIYSNYHLYQALREQQKELNIKIKNLENKRKLTKKQKKELSKYKAQSLTLSEKLKLLQEYEKNPFKKVLTPPNIEDVPKVGNPFAIISALSFQKKLNAEEETYTARYNSLENILSKLKEEDELLKRIIELNSSNEKYIEAYKENQMKIDTFSPVMEIFKTTNNVYHKKIDEIKLNLKDDITQEIEKTMTIGAVILFLLFLLFLIKYLVRKYMSGNDRFYTINKAINITFILLSLLTLLLAYIENVSYLVTILGFASAGIAIAMKEWFMSLMGWLTIVIGGSIHVGDRVKFVRNGTEYVGDIVDISMLRMTMHEDITLTTTITNRRAGRIVFIPNNFIFTDMISNYAHAGLKTVWDGIDFVVTFDSDIHKASQIAKEITKKYSKGYTDITRKQLNKLRSQYSMKNTNVEPRIFTFIEPYGMKISSWYLTNSYATLTLRSTISAEIISRIQKEENIHLAFPTQSIYIDKDVRKPKYMDDGLFEESEL